MRPVHRNRFSSTSFQIKVGDQASLVIGRKPPTCKDKTKSRKIFLME